MYSDMWRFDTSRDWEVLGEDFAKVSTAVAPDITLRALGFHLSPMGYFEKGAPRFVDVIDEPNIMILPVELITNSEDKKMRKKKQRKAKKKKRLCTSMRACVTYFTTLLLFPLKYFAPMSGFGSPTLLLSSPESPIPLFGLGSPTPTSCLRSFIFAFCLGSPISMSCLRSPAPTSYSRSPTFLSYL